MNCDTVKSDIGKCDAANVDTGKVNTVKFEGLKFDAGDLVIFYGRDFTSHIIEWATRGPSHVGIVCPHGDLGPVLFESTTLCETPCLLTGKSVRGVQAHEPAARIASYPGVVARLQLTQAWRLSTAEIGLLHDWLMHVANEPYDLRGALLSGTRLFKWTALMPYPDLESLFCSELCAAALMRLARMPLENPSVYNPASLVRELRRCGTYGEPQFIKLASRGDKVSSSRFPSLHG